MENRKKKKKLEYIKPSKPGIITDTLNKFGEFDEIGRKANLLNRDNLCLC